MKIGLVYPQIELGGDPDAVRRMGQATDDGGYDHIVAYDHVLGAVHEGRQPALTGPYTERDPFHDPFVMFAYLAGRHERLGFATGILILPQRQTVLVARQAADLALLSGGRFRLGVGTGWNPVEYEALGQEFATRGKRQEEQVDLIRRLWTGDVVSFDGRFDTVDRAALVPVPGTAPEIWLGGFSAPVLRRAARIADGFIFGGPRAVVFDQWQTLRSLVADAGRSVEGFGGEYLVLSRNGPADVAAKMQEWETLGGTHASVVTMNLGLDSTEAHVDYVGAVAEAIRLG